MLYTYSVRPNNPRHRPHLHHRSLLRRNMGRRLVESQRRPCTFWKRNTKLIISFSHSQPTHPAQFRHNTLLKTLKGQNVA